MGKFFTPSPWEGKTGDVLKFKPMEGTVVGGKKPKADGAAKKKKPKKKSQKQEPEPLKGRGPLAPKADKLSGVRNGGVKKQKKVQKPKKLKMNAALAKAATDALASETKMDVEEETTTTALPQETKGAASSLEERLKSQLSGGRFRYINEQLYTMTSKKAVALFQNDRDAFGAYHTGYRSQVRKWPINPLNRIVKMVRRLPKTFEIGDFGCGDGQLAKLVHNKVYSMDLVSARDDIIACDMADTPLKTHSLDCAVYCLSLMGTNLNDYLLEANRVLKVDGYLFIAEIQSRFEDVGLFVHSLKSFGFELIKRDASVKLFHFFQFTKTANVGKVAIVPQLTLKPCMYRKR